VSLLVLCREAACALAGVRDHPGMVSGGAPGPAAFAGSNMTAAEKRARGYGLPPVYTPADGVQCNAWAFCASPLGCTAGSPGAGQALTPQVGGPLHCA
jgi:hypothetical protein